MGQTKSWHSSTRAGFEGLSGEVRPADGEVGGGPGLQRLDGVGVEAGVRGVSSRLRLWVRVVE